MVKDLMKQLKPPVQSAVGPVVQKWENYFQKVSARVEEILAEGDQGVTEILQMSPLDPGPISGAFSALQARFNGITSKVDSAMEKIGEEWDGVVDGLDLEDEAQRRTLRMMWNQMLKQKDIMVRDVEKKSYYLGVRKYCEWARILYKTATQELQQPRSCPSCGADVHSHINYAAANVVCPFCKAVNTIEVGPATGYYFQGLGVHSLAEEAALQQWTAMFDAEYAYKDMRNPTEQDFSRFLGAARAYWEAYYETFIKLNPGFPSDKKNAVDAKMAHYTAHETNQDRQNRAVMGAVVQLAAAKDPNRILQYIQSVPQGQFDMDEAVRCIYDHGDRDGAVLLMKIQHKMEGADESVDEYVREKLSELEEN